MYNLPYTVRMMVRAGKRRRCVIKFYQWPNGRSLDVGRVVAMSV